MTAYYTPDSSVPIDQGDIFRDIYFAAVDSHTAAVVITPTCDLVQDKEHSFVKLVAVVPLEKVIKAIAGSVGIDETFFSSGEEISHTKSKKLIKALDNNIDGSLFPRFYFISEFVGVFPHSYVDLQQVFVIPKIQLYSDYIDNRIAKLKSPWREQIVAQYSGYSMRVGVPEYSEQEIRSIAIAAGLNIPAVND